MSYFSKPPLLGVLIEIQAKKTIMWPWWVWWWRFFYFFLMAYTKLLFFLAWSCRKLWKYFMNTLINILSTFCPIFMFHMQKSTRNWILKADMSLCWVVLDYVVKRNEFILLNPYIALLCWYSLRCCSNFIWLHYSSNKLRFFPTSTMSCFFLERKQKLTVLWKFLENILPRNSWKVNFWENDKGNMKVLHCIQLF